MLITGAKLRTAKYRVSGDRTPDYSEVVAILRSEYGFSFLEHVMAGERPAWFKGVCHAQSLGNMRRQLAEQQRRIAQLEMAID